MKYTGIELLERLSLLFGPSGYEDEVADFICGQLADTSCSLSRDKLGNVIARLGDANSGKEKVMVSSHMDEVGFMITELCEDGYLKFGTLGSISPTVLVGKRVSIKGRNSTLDGVICTKAIHHKKRDERLNITPISSLYIDVGASSAEELQEKLNIGAFGTFRSEFVRFGKDGCKIKGKALDDRLGCAVMIESARTLSKESYLPFEIYFCFTVREEIGISGARVAAQTVRPDTAIVLETTAVADIAGVPERSRVALQGDGGALSIMDRATIYDRSLLDAAIAIAKEKSIDVQIKKFVSGGNDASHIHKSGNGVRTLALSAPTRYLHSPACVVDTRDYFSMISLVDALLTSKKFTERKE